MSFATIFLAVDAAAPKAGNPVTQITDQFGLNAWGFICQVISFSIVAYALYRFAYAPILKVLEERRVRIEEGLANATRVEQKLAEATKTAEALRQQAAVDSAKLIAEAQAAAKVISEKENQRAVQQAGEIIQKAREAGEAEQKRLMAELRKELSRLIVETTAKVTGKVLSSSDQKKITEEATKELAA